MSDFEIEVSDNDEPQQELKPTQEIIKEYQIRKLPQKPKKRILTKEQLESSRKNLEKARKARMKKISENKKTPKDDYGYKKMVVEDSDYSDDYTDEEYDDPRLPREYSEPKPKKSVKAKSKLHERLEKIENVLQQLSNVKKQNKKKSTHKTIIVQPPPQYITRSGTNAQTENLKKTLLLDLF